MFLHLYFYFLLLFVKFSFTQISIEDHGAIPNNNSTSIASNNSIAIVNALYAANNSQTQANRTVIVPTGNTYYFFNFTVSDLYNVTLKVDGTLASSDNIDEWIVILNKTGNFQPNVGGGDHVAIIVIMNSINFELTGDGILDGQGHAWWYDFFNHVPSRDFRPMLFRMIHSKDVEIHNIHFRNSPFWTMDFYDMLDMHMHDLDVYVDFPAQQEFARKSSIWNWTGDFPANTDGMDLRGRNILVENLVIEVGDDGVAVKPTPTGGAGVYSNCSQDMLIRNITTIYTEGMAIGSIWPDPNVNCIRNITFENIHHTMAPFRGVDIKTNNQGIGSGIVKDITIINMTAEVAPSAYMYIGPMTQGVGTNGMKCDGDWPKNPNATCDPNPLITVSNIYIENAICNNCHGWLPGAIWCHPTNPCTNITFVNVQIGGNFGVTENYMCQGASGTQTGSNRINGSCLEMVGGASTQGVATTQVSTTCPNGWYTSKTNPHKCLQFISKAYTASEAIAACYVSNAKSTLISINSAFENNEIQQTAQSSLSNCNTFYIGLQKNASIWGWSNGDNSSYANWDSGYPNNSPTNNCAFMKLHDGKWQNTACNEYDCYACQLFI